jgi:hypothetical protein
MNRKTILRFLIVFISSLIAFELFEFAIEKVFDIELHNLEIAWIGGIVLFMFKSHIICCLIPAIWTSYKCHHKEKKECNHEHCS